MGGRGRGRARGRGQDVQPGFQGQGPRPGGRGRSRGPPAGGAPGGAWQNAPPRQQTAWRPQGAPPPQQQAWRQQAPPQQAPAPQQSAWGAPRAPPQQAPAPQQSAWGAPRAATPQQSREAGDQAVTSLASRAQAMSLTGNGNGNGGAAPVGRGAQRGRREQRVDLIRTKPNEVMTKQGDIGNPINLITNYYRMSKRPQWSLQQYHVDFEPEEDRTFMRKILMKPHKATLGEYIFDGMVLYLLQYVPDGFQLASKRELDDTFINIKIKHIREVPCSDYQFLQFFNIIMRKCQGHLNLTLLGRNYYDSGNIIQIRDHRLELWPGYLTAIRQHEDNVLMCVDITHRVLRTDTVLQLMHGIQGGGDPRKRITDLIVGCIVITRYNNKTYRVDDIAWDESPRSTFDKKGQRISYVEYFQQTWEKHRITDLQQPLLISKPKARDIHRGQTEHVRLIPELCYLTGLNDSMRDDFRLMKDLGVHMHPAADVRLRELRRFMERMQKTELVTKETNNWGLRFESNLEEVRGRVLPVEALGQRGQKPLQSVNADWTRAMQMCSMPVVIQLAQWAVIVPERESDATRNFVNKMIQNASKMGMNIHQPAAIKLRGIRASDYLQAIDSSMQKFGDIQMVMAVLPNNKKDLYAAIKKKMYVDHGIASQALTARTVKNEKGIMSISTKVAIQLNCKLGGEPWTGSNPLKRAMVVGFDVYHESSRSSASVGALVASYNANLTKYYGVTARHQNLSELSDFISTQMVLAIQNYKLHNNNAVPEQIFIYRDGVGEGQVQHVFEIELKNVLEKLEPFYEKKIKLAFIIVTKRINTRLFQQASGRVENPPSGTVVDSVITHPERYDFYLVSQRVTQGTVSPIACNVIYDTTGISAGRIQLFTFKLCHLYFNWTGTVRVPAPCQYAHKLAYMVGENLRGQEAPHRNLLNVLYYL